MAGGFDVETKRKNEAKDGSKIWEPNIRKVEMTLEMVKTLKEQIVGWELSLVSAMGNRWMGIKIWSSDSKSEVNIREPIKYEQYIKP